MVRWLQDEAVPVTNPDARAADRQPAGGAGGGEPLEHAARCAFLDPSCRRACVCSVRAFCAALTCRRRACSGDTPACRRRFGAPILPA